jgi:ATP-binding cassette subfamily C protein
MFLKSRTNESRAASPVTDAFASFRAVLVPLALTSGVINVLTLTGSIFMMQVYDRVLGSQSVPTLVGLSLLALGAYVFQGKLEILRNRILTLVGEKVDTQISATIHDVGLRTTLASPAGGVEAMQAVRDVEAIRTFVSGTGLVAALDFPWLPLYLLTTFLLHPWLGGLTVIGAVALMFLTWRTEVASREPMKRVFEAGNKRNQVFDASMRGAEAVAANGMGGHLAARAAESHAAFLRAQRDAAFITGRYASYARSARMLLQSCVLGLGAYLAIKGQISAGAIIAASILSARALAPIDQAIASWRPFVAARDGYRRLKTLTERTPAEAATFKLAAPNASLTAQSVTVVPPGAKRAVVADVSFQLKAGDAMGIIGGSGSGKSSLVRVLANAWKPVQGIVRIDGSTFDQWSRDEIGKSIGYLPQDFQLFEGTIAQNIGRFDPKATAEAVTAAAQAAGIDQYIRTELGGYDTPIGPGGTLLSAGQRQRVGLARALYGDPFLVILDEPNSNLDPDGELALQAAVKAVRARRGIVIVVTHREPILEAMNHMAVLRGGAVIAVGPVDEVRKKLAQLRPARPRPDEAANGHDAVQTAKPAFPVATPPPPSRPDPSDGQTQWSTSSVRLRRPIDRRPQ